MQRRQKLQLVVALGLGLLLVSLIGPGLAWAVDLLANGSFEQFQSYDGQEWRGFPEKYGAGWSVKVLSGEDSLHLMDSDTYGKFLAAVFGLPYLNYRLEGTLSQVATSRYGYNFVLSQTVATQPGQAYAFGGKIVTFWKGPGPEVDHTKIFKRIGIDPSGGTDYDGPNVAWTGWDSLDNAWTSPALAVLAGATQATVFIQIDNRGEDVGPAHLNPSHIDSFKFELAPVAQLNLPDTAPPGPINVSWGVTIPDPGYWNLWGYDVEFRDDPAGPWQTIQEHTGGNRANTSYVLPAEAGKIYSVRVRPWQQHGPGGDPIIAALPGLWLEKTVIVGQAITGRVINHAGLGLGGVTVTASGVAMPAVSGSGGRFTIATGVEGDFEVQASDFEEYIAPPATQVTVTSSAATYVTITLRPGGAGQALQNNDFETGADPWQSSDGSPISTANGQAHTGSGGLLLTGSASIFQSGTAADMDNPLLSFWYKADSPFTVQLLATGALTPVNEASVAPATEWTHYMLDWRLDEPYSGAIGARFIPGPGSAYIDEVSLAAGPERIYLPVIKK